MIGKYHINRVFASGVMRVRGTDKKQRLVLKKYASIPLVNNPVRL